jgi:hypothetical protein
MKTTCMLHNNKSCAKENSIKRAHEDNYIRVVYGYDWNTHSDNYVLIFEQVEAAVAKFSRKYSNEVKFERLGGKDASIYCDICRQIQSADIAIFDLSTNNLNVILELGLSIGTGKYIFIVRSKHYKRISHSISDLNGILEYRFSRRYGRIKFAVDFQRSLLAKLRHIAKIHSN